LLQKFRLAPAVLMLTLCTHVAGDGLRLKKDVELIGSAAVGKDAPVFIVADQIESTQKNVVEAEGQVEVRRAGQVLFADWLRYDLNLDEIRARGQVRLEKPSLVVTGDTLRLKLDDHSGEIDKPVYQFVDNPRRGDATHIEFINDNQYRLQDATYTTCPADQLDWQLKAENLDIDKSSEVGTARNVTLDFLGTPVFYSPWLNFPLTTARKSGFLAPTAGSTQAGGFDIVTPYYLNLAPNYDATLYPRWLSKRGLQLGVDFRDLHENSSGNTMLQYLADDQETGTSRWGAFLKQQLHTDGGLTAGFDYNRVSDDNYFRDLSSQASLTSQTNLNQEVWLGLNRGWWSLDVRMQNFQTLQDPSAPIVPPYFRVPQVSLHAAQTFAYGLQFSLDAAATRFTHPTLVDGARLLATPTLTLPLTYAAGYLTPKLDWHLSHYNLGNLNNLNDTAPERSLSYSIPIASIDAGLFLERPFSFNGQNYVQTLEPRAFYVYAPYVNQNAAPIFDTTVLDFSYVQMFSDNSFIGGDRVNNANQMTLALTSRFTESDSGIERLKLTLAQRYYFTTQLVTLHPTDPPVRDGQATDLLLAVSGQVTKAWRAATGWQVDSSTGQTQNLTLDTSYRPGPGRTLNFGYRFINGSTEQVDLSAQWPLSTRWQGMFRYNYSLLDKTLVEGLAGLEYNAGCWAVRGVFQHLVVSQSQTNNSVFFQLELNGMGQLGINPLKVLKQSIPGYMATDDFTETPTP
jgi:LPS-assembly protein